MRRAVTGAVVVALVLGALAPTASGQSARDAGRAPVAPDAGRAPTAPAVAPVVAPVVAPPAESPFNGVWRHAGGEADQRALEASVARTVQGLGFIIEGIAASRLRDSSAIPPTITIRVANNVVEYTGLRGRLIRSPADGTAVQTQNAQGESVTLSTRVTGALMVRNGQRPEGGRREELRVNGNTLIVDGVVSSPRLPRPLTYRFTYRR